MSREIQFYAIHKGEEFKWCDDLGDYNGLMLNYYCGGSALAEFIGYGDSIKKMDELKLRELLDDLQVALKDSKKDKEVVDALVANVTLKSYGDVIEFAHEVRDKIDSLESTIAFIKVVLDISCFNDIYVVDSY